MNEARSVNEARSEPTLHVVPPMDHAPAEAEVELDQRASTGRVSRRRRHRRWIVPLIAIAAAAALWSVLWQPQTVSRLPLAPPAPPAKAPAAPPPPTSAPRFPIEETVAALPPLDGSDATVLAALHTLVGGGRLSGLLESRDLVRNTVVTVDNLPRKTLPSQKLPIKPVQGSFGTASANGGLVISETNAQRYTPYVRLLETVDATRLVQLYTSFYPLFQQAYRELGYPNGHFNDRLVEAIDVILATPEAPATIAVVQPKIFYAFADPALEALPAGQKLMLRMGRDNAERVKGRLREIRALLVAPSARALDAPNLLPRAATSPR